MNRVKKILESAAKNNRVASAYLFVGGALENKIQSTQEFAAVLDCKKQDIFEVKPSGATIKIEQIRELSSWVRYGPSAGEYLVAIIKEADKMTPEASAAFLKTLEEPAPGVVFVLIAQREEKLSQTIISRCQKIIFPEILEDYQPKEEWSSLYPELEKISRKSVVEVLGFSEKLLLEKEKIEDLLYDFAKFFRYQRKSISACRTILDAIRSIKKKVNLKLALDVMNLRLASHG